MSKKVNTTLVQEAIQWLDSFSFIGTVFLVEGQKYSLKDSTLNYVVMCNIKEVSKQVQIVSYQDFMEYSQPMLVIQMDNRIGNERAITLSSRILLELAFSTPIDDLTFKKYMQEYFGIYYNAIFSRSYRTELNQVVKRSDFQQRCLDFIEETLQMIYEEGLTYDLMLEAKIYPIFQGIFHDGFLMDVKALKNEYKMIYNENTIMLHHIVNRYNVNPDDLTIYDRLDLDGQQVLKRYQKNHLLLKKYPMKKLVKTVNGKVNPYLKCSYKQIGTKTFRISTSHINVYGLPKRLRQHLVPNEGKVFVEADYHASQLIIVANLAKEDWIIKAYEQGKDIYHMFATIFFDKKEEKIQPNERKAMKQIFFAYINGARRNTLLDILEKLDIFMSEEHIKNSIQRLQASISEIGKYLKSLRYRSNVMTPTGRWWREEVLPVTKKRAAYIIQIVEAEILFNAVILVQKDVLKFKGMRIYLTKHDSITIEAPSKYMENAKSILKVNLTKAVQLFFDMEIVHINVTVMPHKEKENISMINKIENQIDMAILKNLRNQANARRKVINPTNRPVPEKEYVALITNETQEEDGVIKVFFTVFINKTNFNYTARFLSNTNSFFYYEKMIETLNSAEESMVGKLCMVVFHKNEQYINIEVIEEISEDELGIDLMDDTEEIQEVDKRNSTISSKIKRQLLEEEEDEDEEDEYEDEEVE